MQIVSGHIPKCSTLFNGNDKSPCPLPCTTFQIKKQIISTSSVKNKGDLDEGRIRILFSSNVQVSRTDFVKPTLARFKLIQYIPSIILIPPFEQPPGGGWGLNGSLAWFGGRPGSTGYCHLPQMDCTFWKFKC